MKKKLKIRPIPDEDWNVRAYWGVYVSFVKRCSIVKLRTQPLSNFKLKL